MEAVVVKALTDLVVTYGASVSGWVAAFALFVWHVKDKNRLLDTLITVLNDNTAANVTLAGKFDLLISTLRGRAR